MVSVAGLPFHKTEVRGLGAQAIAAIALGAWYCSSELTDGYISTVALMGLGIRQSVTEKLVEKGIWKRNADGSVEVVDYLKHNPTRAQVESRRKSSTERSRRHRATQCITPPATPLHLVLPTPSLTSNGTDPSPTPPLLLSSLSGSSPDPESSSTLSSSPKDLTGSARDSETRANVERVFAHWVTFTGNPRAVLDRKREQRIRARLREGFTPDQLCRAITNARHDRFLMGENKESRVYNGMQTLLRDAEQVERLLALVPNGNRANGDLRPDRAEAVERILASARRPTDG